MGGYSGEGEPALTFVNVSAAKLYQWNTADPKSVQERKIKMKRMNLQDVKLTQIRCQNLSVSTTDRL
jgi:hypothetical protein